MEEEWKCWRAPAVSPCVYLSPGDGDGGGREEDGLEDAVPAPLQLLRQRGQAGGVRRHAAPAAPHPRQADVGRTDFSAFGTFWVGRKVSFSVTKLLLIIWMFPPPPTCSYGTWWHLTMLSRGRKLLPLHSWAQQIPANIMSWIIILGCSRWNGETDCSTGTFYEYCRKYHHYQDQNYETIFHFFKGSLMLASFREHSAVVQILIPYCLTNDLNFP